MKPALSMAALLLAYTPLLAGAAQQGELGKNSSSSYSISLSIEPAMEIRTVSDIALNISDRTVDATFSKPFCVRGSVPGKYMVTASGGNQSGDGFELHNANHDVLRYHVSYRGDPGATQFDPLSPGIPSRAYDVLPRDATCGNLTAFMVTFRAADLQNAGSGLYTGSLTLLVSPV
jgi:hypothetical protein